MDKLRPRTKSFDVEAFDASVRVRVKTRFAPPVFDWGLNAEYVYTITEDGAILLEVEVTPDGEIPLVLPRIGLVSTLPSEMMNVTWYGKGPGESYIDTQSAAKLGLWQATVDELFTNYVRPQENGNRTDVRWVRVTDAQGIGFEAHGDPVLNFSAQRYTAQDLTKAEHTYELEPRETVTLALDHRHQGIGTASCGPSALKPYELNAEPFHFAYRLLPVVR